MKKKFLFAALSAGLTLGLGSTAFAATTYEDIYHQYVSQYGKTEILTETYEYMDEPEKTVNGVSFLGLYDLDGNGTDELLIGYTTPNPQQYSFCKYIFGLDVYTQNNGDATLCGKIAEAEMWTGGEQDCGIRLMTKDGIIYIVSGSEGTGAGSIHHFYTLSSGNKLEEMLSYEIEEEIKINGEKSDIAYQDLWTGWTTLLHSDLYGFEASWTDFDPEASLERINTVVKQLSVTAPAAPTIKKVQSPQKGQALVSWKKVAKASGYQIRYSTKKSMKSAKAVSIKKGSTTSKRIKGLKSGKTYYFQLRAYTKSNGKNLYSAWCKYKKKKVA